jgi:hypothetical protein
MSRGEIVISNAARTAIGALNGALRSFPASDLGAMENRDALHRRRAGRRARTQNGLTSELGRLSQRRQYRQPLKREAK